MRTALCWGALVTLLGLGVSCDTEQPDRVGARTAQITVRAPNALVDAYNVWDVFEDSNPSDNQPDDLDGDGNPDFTLWCEGPVGNGSANSLPWSFSMRISVIRAGTTTPVVLTNSASLMNGNNRAIYDDASLTGNFLPFPSSVGAARVQVDSRVFGFTNPRRMTIVNAQLLRAPDNYLRMADPQMYDGRCPKPPGMYLNANPEGPEPDELVPPTISGQTQPFSVQLGAGDTLIVEGRRFNTPPSGISVYTEPAVSASFTVDGQLVGNLLGTTSSTTQPDSGFSFSFTAR